MTNRGWTLKKLSHEGWELTLSVDSDVIDPLTWVWRAGVSLEGGPNGSTAAVASAVYTPVGMPDGDRTGSHSSSRRLTLGISGLQVGELESMLDQWEQECRRISSVLDRSVMNRRRDLERQKAAEERKAEDRQNAEALLDSLVTDDPDP